MSYELRIYEDSISPYEYVIGGDPAEGLAHGDDSVLQVFCLDTGFQCAELQGKVDPFSFAELAYMLGRLYNNALIGIESNKDGGANRLLHELDYPYIYKEMLDKGKSYDQHTDKLGININIRNRHKLVAQARHYMSDNSVALRSRLLHAQMEIFVLRNTKFEAIPGGHDDLVMAYVIACEMLRIGWLFQEARTTELSPLIDGQPIEESGGSDLDVLYRTDTIDRHVDQVRRLKEREEPDFETTVESLV